MQAVSAGSSNLHPPFAKSECAACHDVHGSANNHLLSSPDPMFWIPNGVDAKSFSCFGCHDQGTYLLNGTYPRPASVTRPNSALPTQFVAFPSTTPATAKNLHFSHVVEAGAGCLACHDPHGNDNSHLLRPYFTYTDPGSGFWSRTSCKGCHNGQIPPDLNSLW
jgi:predicted CXXCH cytochrome family protein